MKNWEIWEMTACIVPVKASTGCYKLEPPVKVERAVGRVMIPVTIDMTGERGEKAGQAHIVETDEWVDVRGLYKPPPVHKF